MDVENGTALELLHTTWMGLQQEKVERIQSAFTHNYFPKDENELKQLQVILRANISPQNVARRVSQVIVPSLNAVATAEATTPAGKNEVTTPTITASDTRGADVSSRPDKAAAAAGSTKIDTAAAKTSTTSQEITTGKEVGAGDIPGADVSSRPDKSALGAAVAAGSAKIDTAAANIPPTPQEITTGKDAGAGDTRGADVSRGTDKPERPSLLEELNLGGSYTDDDDFLDTDDKKYDSEKEDGKREVLTIPESSSESSDSDSSSDSSTKKKDLAGGGNNAEGEQGEVDMDFTGGDNNAEGQESPQGQRRYQMRKRTAPTTSPGTSLALHSQANDSNKRWRKMIEVSEHFALNPKLKLSQLESEGFSLAKAATPAKVVCEGLRDNGYATRATITVEKMKCVVGVGDVMLTKTLLKARLQAVSKIIVGCTAKGLYYTEVIPGESLKKVKQEIKMKTWSAWKFVYFHSCQLSKQGKDFILEVLDRQPKLKADASKPRGGVRSGKKKEAKKTAKTDTEKVGTANEDGGTDVTDDLSSTDETESDDERKANEEKAKKEKQEKEERKKKRAERRERKAARKAEREKREEKKAAEAEESSSCSSSSSLTESNDESSSDITSLRPHKRGKQSKEGRGRGSKPKGRKRNKKSKERGDQASASTDEKERPRGKGGEGDREKRSHRKRKRSDSSRERPSWFTSQGLLGGAPIIMNLGNLGDIYRY